MVYLLLNKIKMQENYFLKKNILISGQVLNSLTEMLEDYLKSKVKCLGVIGISSPYSTPGSARVTSYENRKLKFNRRIFNIYFRKRRGYDVYLLVLVFVVYYFSLIFSALRFRKKFDYFIGIACFSTSFRILLKWLGVVKKVVFYSIDYFPLQKTTPFEYYMGKSFFILDRFCAKHSDLVWYINPDIAEARSRFGGMDSSKYQTIHVPLGYTEDLLCFRPFSEIERYTIGFVGTLNPNQGLQMVLKAFPKIVKNFPMAKLEIIGDGIFATTVKQMANESSVSERIIFHGFIGDRKKVSQILSKCALGIAPWTMDKDNNIKYADPGKPKHYAFCGLPIIMTRSNILAYEIERMRVGITINYDEVEFIEAVSHFFKDDEFFKEYKNNTLKFAHKYISDNIYREAMIKTEEVISNG